VKEEESYKIFSEFYDEFIAKNCGAMHDKYFKFVTEYIEQKQLPHESILDIPCGTGILMKKMSEYGYNVIGIDKNEFMLSKAKHKGLDVHVGDVRNFEVEHNLDIVLSFDSFGHMSEDGELERVFNSVHRNLKDKGTFIFDIDSRDGINRMANERYTYESPKYSFEWINHIVGDGLVDIELMITKKDHNVVNEFVEHHIVRGYDTDELEQLLGKTGFETVFISSEPIIKARSILCIAEKR
jgi:predicted TPR repeat methyltransferase